MIISANDKIQYIKSNLHIKRRIFNFPFYIFNFESALSAYFFKFDPETTTPPIKAQTSLQVENQAFCLNILKS